jgi:hypothetical protein
MDPVDSHVFAEVSAEVAPWQNVIQKSKPDVKDSHP